MTEPVATMNLPQRGWLRMQALLARALARRCPYCGNRGIFSNYFSLKDACPSCGAVFAREDGYFLGAYALNLVVAEILGLGTILVFLFRTDLSLLWQETIAVSAAIALPILFYPWSRSLWMAIDLQADPATDDKHLRADKMRR